MPVDKQSQAQQIVNSIIRDLCTRKGLDDEWDTIDADIRDEIREQWIALAVQVLGETKEQ